MQSYERPAFRDLAGEALNARPVFGNLPQDVQLEVVDGVTQMITDLDSECRSRWNNVTFLGSDILVFRRPYEGHVDLAQLLRQKLKAHGLHHTRSIALVDGSLIDVAKMIQGHITTMEELKRTLGKFERGRAGSKGRIFHSNEVGPPNTIRTGLL